MTRPFSIRSRTALVFAAGSMLITAAVLLFVNLASQSSLNRLVLGGGPSSGVAGPMSHATPRPTPLLRPPGTAGDGVSLVTQVSTFQWQWSAVGILGAGLLAGVLGWWLSRRMLRPIDAITDTTNRISASNLHERVTLQGPQDELSRLAATINALLQRLESAFETQRRFVAHASHELRTPLAIQRAIIQIGLEEGSSEVERTDAREQLLQINRRNEHLVESLLLLAEAERGLDGHLHPIRLEDLVRDTLTTNQGFADEHSVSTTAATGDAAPVPAPVGQAVLVRHLIDNLVRNAIEYNHPGGYVHVVVDDVGLLIENSGPELDPSLASALVEPFRRVPGSGRSDRHSGLGLSIVAAIAAAHQWTLTLTPRAGGGLSVRVDVSRM